MKKLIIFILTTIVVLSLCACGPKQYKDLNESEKKIVSAASAFHAEYPAAQDVTIAADPILFTDYNGNEYIMLSLKFTENGISQHRGVDFKNGHPVGFGASEINDPEGIIDNSPEGKRAVIEARTIWDAYVTTLTDGGNLIGKPLLDGTLQIASVEEFEKKDLENVVNACFIP